MSHSGLDDLISTIQNRRPARTWSLIVSFFGVLALPDSRPLRLSDLQDWLARLAVEPGLVRTALSRLVASGTLLRERDGKAALYRLSAAAEQEFRQAAGRIFGPDLPQPTGRLELALLDQAETRQDWREALSAAEFVPLVPHALIRPEHRARPAPTGPGLFVLHADADRPLAERAPVLWPLAELAQGYRAIIAPADRLKEAQLSTGDACLARVLLVHEFRRLVLRDPGLPPSLLPIDWPGDAARTAFDRTMAVLSVPNR